MYELIILSVLMQSPAHGFLVVKIINDIIGPIARASNGRVYPLLSKLAEAGLVEVHDETTSETGLPLRIYRITEKGRRRFHELMLDVSSHPREYRDMFAFKAVMLPLLPKEERLYIIDSYIAFCEAHIRHFIAEVNDHKTRIRDRYQEPRLADAAIQVMEHQRRVWELELAWATSLRAAETGEAARPTARPSKRSKRQPSTN